MALKMKAYSAVTNTKYPKYHVHEMRPTCLSQYTLSARNKQKEKMSWDIPLEGPRCSPLNQSRVELKMVFSTAQTQEGKKP